MQKEVSSLLTWLFMYYLLNVQMDDLTVVWTMFSFYV